MSTNICQLIPSLGLGGAEQVAIRIANQSSDNFDHTICYFGIDDTLLSEIKDSVNVYSFGLSRRYDVRMHPRFYNVIKSNDFDVIHAHLPYAQMLARTCPTDASLISTHHNEPGLYGFPERQVEIATRFRDAIEVTVSENVRQRFASLSLGRTKWKTIYNGIEVVDFHDKVEKSSQPPVDVNPRTTDVLLNVGSYQPSKGQKRLLTEFAKLLELNSDVHLLVVGGGPLHDDLRALIRKLDIEENVTLTGEVPRARIHQYYSIADAFVLSSESEGFPIVHLEAMAAELPIVTTNFGAVEEVVKDGETGIIVENGNLYGGMRRLLSDNRRSELGHRSYERVLSQFDSAKMVNEYEQLYCEVT